MLSFPFGKRKKFASRKYGRALQSIVRTYKLKGIRGDDENG